VYYELNYIDPAVMIFILINQVETLTEYDWSKFYFATRLRILHRLLKAAAAPPEQNCTA